VDANLARPIAIPRCCALRSTCSYPFYFFCAPGKVDAR
jgi:hypothetical protein